MPAPTVTAVTNKVEYLAGEQVTVIFTVTDVPNDVQAPRVIAFTGTDEEGNSVSGEITVITNAPNPESFTLTEVRWADTGVPFAIDGLQATGAA